MLKQSVLLIHSILGMVIFLTGVLQILQKKGGKWHRFTGRIYLHGWLRLLLSGAYLGGLLITVIGVFGYYFSLTGARIGQIKQ
ncbi:MAG: hypothetical protein EOO04_20720 [Chitinophagaceae bacterium]|nr:MAG: hypothetical protein EOO04_20720 [Chitinophagaceae bacterium]